MGVDNIKDVVTEANVPIEDPLFFPRVFTLVAKERKLAYARDADNFKRVCAEEYDDLSKRLDRTKIQESTAVRNILRTRRLANLLINDKGDINTSLLPKVINHLSKTMYSLGPNRQFDAKRQEQILKALKLLQDNKDVVRHLKNIGRPYSHKYAEQVIRDTLMLPANTVITDAHARRAALSALMCYLRQNVGSCFATAPSIIVHDEQPDQFLIDLNELLGTGRLKRTYGGVEYSVPLSASWGAGDLKRNIMVAIHPDSTFGELWLSPGLLNAFEAAGIIDSEKSLKDRILASKQLIVKFLSNIETKQPYVIISPEELIRGILLQHLGITAKDLEDFDNRPHAMIHSSLLMQMSQTGSGMGGKGQACASFYQLFETACNAFKGIADNALLKTWEFTVASFSENKSGFTTWNLYSSLGMGSNEPGGIGQCLYGIVQHKVDQYNNKVQQIQIEYEQVYAQVKTMETRARSLSSERDAAWLKAELQSKVNEFYTLEEIRDKANNKAHRFANLFNDLLNTYYELFPNYFQEVYDADMHDVAAGPYDDSPAGFRLLYKHGRANTSMWTRIKNHNEFIEALVSFFTATETEIVSMPEFEGMHQELSDIVTALVNHVRTPDFLESAFYRMAVAHHVRPIKNPLENLDKIEKKPWVYTSGGTMGTLVSSYWRREQKPSEVSRWVENPTELLIFFIDSLKQMPPKMMDDLMSNPKKGFLMHSPTHAFLLKPGFLRLKEAWNTDDYTYTWVRDNIIRPMEKFWNAIDLDEDKMNFLIEALVAHVSENFKFYFKKVFSNMKGNMNVREFRNQILETIDHERGLRYGGSGVLSADEIDSTLYSLLPLFPSYQLKDKLKAILSKLSIDPAIWQNAMEIYNGLPGSSGSDSLISAKGLQDICKALLCLTTGETSTPFDAHISIAMAAQELGYAPPAPMLFADSNWVKDDFGFVVNPGNGHFELWRMDYTGTVGAPMSQWEQWLNGSRKDISWGIYNRPYEYSK